MRGSLEAETWYKDEQESIAFVVLNGINDVVRNNVSDMTYEVISGEGSFSVSYNDGVVGRMGVKPGEKIGIPRGLAYQDCGNMIMLVTATPPFNPEDVVIVKETL